MRERTTKKRKVDKDGRAMKSQPIAETKNSMSPIGNSINWQTPDENNSNDSNDSNNLKTSVEQTVGAKRVKQGKKPKRT